MKFNLNITDDGHLKISAASPPGCTDIQTSSESDDLYDQVRKVTWVYNGRSYEAIVRRGKQIASGGP
jgi:hypothetical protein